MSWIGSSQISASLPSFAIPALHGRLQSANLSLHGARGMVQRSGSIEGAATGGEETRTSLDGHGIFAICVFAAVSLVVIRPLRIPIPRRVAGWIRKIRSDVWPALVSNDDVKQGPDDRAGEQENGEAFSRPTMYLIIDHVSAPLIGVLLLLATTTIRGQEIRTGIVGEDGIQPYDVLLLFISLAYIAISLDATGLLRYLAFLICLKSGKPGEGASGRKMYLLLYLFFWSAGVLVGNDPVILSGTAFLVYLTRVAGITPPDAWIWAEFVAANISSAVLVSSNPTNLVIATGFGIEFITYTAYMIMPAFASAAAALVCLLVCFRNRRTEDGAKARTGESVQSGDGGGTGVRAAEGRFRHRGAVRPWSHRGHDSSDAAADGAQDAAMEVSSHTVAAQGDAEETKRAPLVYIPSRIIQPDVEARSALVDLPGAIFGSVVMAATLATLVGTSVVGGVKVFEIAVPGAVLCFARDAIADYLRSCGEEKRRGTRHEDGGEAGKNPTEAGREQQGEVPGQEATIELKTFGTSQIDPKGTDEPSVATSVGTASPSGSPTDQPSSPASAANGKTTGSIRHSPMRPLRPLLLLPSKLARTFPTVAVVLSRLPLPLLPFAFSMFILVQALAHVGFINILASGLGDVCAHGYIVTAFFVSFLGVILCNIGGTNIGATILLTKSVLSPHFGDKLASLDAEEQARVIKMAMYAIAFGSNVGALGGTFAASLAGLLWLSGLRQGGISVRAGQFATWCAIVIVPATVAGVAVLIAEVRFFQL
ncbi:hypothetical protein ACQY0O_007361 [Thecaphora frezii]